jgi:hypothetical protein
MAQAKALQPFMRDSFARAKRLFNWSDACGWAIGVLGAAAALVPPTWEAAGWIAGLAALVLLAAQQFLLYRFRKAFTAAEGVKRAYLVADGCGERISAATLAELNKRHGELLADAEPYYTSHHAPGGKRLLMLVWESAFWSEDLQGVMCDRYFRRAALSTAFFVLVCLGLWYWAKDLGAGAPLIGKALLGVGSLLVSTSFWVRWRECEGTQRECSTMCDRCLTLLKGRKLSNPEVWGAVLDYNATALVSYPIPDKVYATRKDVLNREWEKIAAEHAPDQK